MARHLKRRVEIGVRFQPEREVQRKCVRPALWEAYIAKGPPRARHLACQETTREGAVRSLLERLRGMGYTGTARVVKG